MGSYKPLIIQLRDKQYISFKLDLNSINPLELTDFFSKATTVLYYVVLWAFKFLSHFFCPSLYMPYNRNCSL